MQRVLILERFYLAPVVRPRLTASAALRLARVLRTVNVSVTRRVHLVRRSLDLYAVLLVK